MLGRNKNIATIIFAEMLRLKYFEIVLVRKIIPKPIEIVCNITTVFKDVNIDNTVEIIKEYSGGSLKLPFK